MESVVNFFRWYWQTLQKTTGPYLRFLGIFVAGLALVVLIKAMLGLS